MNLDQLRQKLDQEVQKRSGSDPNKVGVGQVLREVPGAFVKVGKNIGNFFTGNTQAFGRTIGGTAALPGQQRDLEQQAQENENLRQMIMQAIRKNQQAGKDTSKLKATLSNLRGPTIEDINPTINKSNKQVLGEALGTLIEATQASKVVPGARSFSLAEGNAPEIISSASKAITKKAALRQGAKSIAVGAGQGYFYDLASNLQKDKSGKEIFKPGLGTAFGAAIPTISTGVGLIRTEAQLQINDLIRKGYAKADAEKIVNEGGYIRLFQDPKLRELGDKVNELNKLRVNAPNKMLEKRYQKAYEQAVAEYQKLSQGGFVKNPFYKEPNVPEGEQGGKTEGSIGGSKEPPLPTSLPTKQLGKNPSDVSSYYNVDRLNINDKAKQVIKDEISNAQKQLEDTVGTKLSNKEVLDLSSKTSKVLNKTVNRQQTAETIASNLRLRQQIAATAQSGKVDKDFINLWLKDKSIGEDIARQLQARRINADPKETGVIDTILHSIYKVNKNADEIAKAAEGVDFNDPQQVTAFYRKFVAPKATEWLDLLRYNSMLTSPNTHIVNISSNYQGTGILAPIEKTVTGLLDTTRAALTGKPRRYAVGEGAAYAKGYYSNIANATKRFVNVMRGNAFNYNPDTGHLPLTTGGAGKVVENTLNLPLRLLEASDQFFTALTEGGVENSLKYRIAKLGGKATEDVSAEAAYRLFRGGLKPENQGVVLDAVDSLTNLIMHARNSENPIVSQIAKFTLPFVRTPTNILKQGIEYSPFGLTTLYGASNKTEQLSKALIGMGSALGAATLLGQDRLTWAEPVNKKQKAEFRAAGRQPYSIKIGNKWISYSKLHPALAFNFALVSAIDDAVKQKHLDDSQADTLLSGLAKTANFFADQSYLKSIGDFVAATKGDVQGYAAYLSNYPQQLIPFRALLSWVERLTDPVQRQADPTGSIAERQLQQIMTQIPGLAQKVPARVGPLGQPIENQNKTVNAFSPVRITTTNPSYDALYKMDLNEQKINRFQQDIQNRIDEEIRRRTQIR